MILYPPPPSTIINQFIFNSTSSSSSEESCGVRSCSLPDRHSRVCKLDFISRSRLPTSKLQYDNRRSSYSGPQETSSASSSYKKSKFVSTLIWKNHRGVVMFNHEACLRPFAFLLNSLVMQPNRTNSCSLSAQKNCVRKHEGTQCVRICFHHEWTFCHADSQVIFHVIWIFCHNGSQVIFNFHLYTVRIFKTDLLWFEFILASLVSESFCKRCLLGWWLLSCALLLHCQITARAEHNWWTLL